MRLRNLGIMASTAVLVCASAPPANAADSGGHVYVSDYVCTFDKAFATDGSGYGYAAGKVAADGWSQIGNCTNKLFKMGSGALAVRWNYYKKGSNGWYLCKEMGFVKNSSTSHSLKSETNYLSRPCGSGYYSTTSYAYTWWNSSWHGGSIGSGSNHVG